MYSRQLASTEWLTIQGGLLGAALFVCSLTVSFGATRGAGLGRWFLVPCLNTLRRPSTTSRTWCLAKVSRPRYSPRVSATSGEGKAPLAMCAGRAAPRWVCRGHAARLFPAGALLLWAPRHANHQLGEKPTLLFPSVLYVGLSCCVAEVLRRGCTADGTAWLHFFSLLFFPAVLTCLLLALFASGLIHRVCVTTW